MKLISLIITSILLSLSVNSYALKPGEVKFRGFIQEIDVNAKTLVLKHKDNRDGELMKYKKLWIQLGDVRRAPVSDLIDNLKNIKRQSVIAVMGDDGTMIVRKVYADFDE